MISAPDMPRVLELVLIALVATAGIYDFRTRRIPNWLNLSGLILGIGLNGFVSHGSGFSLAAAGFGCAVLVYLPLYLLRGMGAGDVKLMAAVGAISGPLNWLGIFLATALLGGFVSLILVARKNRVYQTWWNVQVIVHELAHGRSPAGADPQLDIHHTESFRMPHGTVIAAGAFTFLILRATALV